MRALVLFLFAAAMHAEDAPKLPQPDKTSITITAAPIQPEIDRRNAEVFSRTLFSRDDQVFHAIDAGINAGQHEGGGKSLEIRRFGFNLDHGGVSGGLKVLVDNVQQNQSTQGHGQGYLGALKSLTPELIQAVDVINGPFNAEYGDFSGLGVVHIRLKDSLPDVFTARLQGGSFGSARNFFSYSPLLRAGDAFVAFETSRTDGPFLNPLGYRRENLTANFTQRLDERQRLGLRFNGGLSRYNSSGQIPLDEVAAGRLSRFGALDPTNGGGVRAATAGLYYQRDWDNGQAFRADGFVGRSLFDLFSNFTFFLNDPENGDGIQQHDSRLQQGANAQFLKPARMGGVTTLFTAGGNFHDNQIHVGLYPQAGRVPLGVASRARAHVTNGAGYAQQAASFLSGRLQLGAGLRYDVFRFSVIDRVEPANGGVRAAANLQPKFNAAFTPAHRFPVTFHLNYGRGIATADARAVVQRPDQPRVATTDFFQAGTSHHLGRVSLTTDLFWVDRSNENVYVPDDGSFEFRGPSRAYGFEAKGSVQITRKLALNGGITKVLNAFYRGTQPREYVVAAPHLTANAGLTVANWAGWSGSFRMRAISHYSLDESNPYLMAAGHTVFDASIARRINRHLELNFSADNVLNRAYYETQNFFESRLEGQLPMKRIHGTPGYPLTATAGVTLRFGGK